MGWDAYSSAKINYSKNEIVDIKLRMLFKNAETDVKEKSVYVDGLLHRGGLDCSDCREMLAVATIENCYEDWDSDKVKLLNESAQWGFVNKIKEEDLWAYWSARFFLKICAENGLSVSFSY